MLNRDYDTYTETLHDALLDDPTLLDGLVLDTDEHTTKLKAVLTAKWDCYEVSGETLPQFKRFLNNRFAVVKDYYIEMITAYETKINMLDGAKTSTTRTTEDTGTASNVSKHIDLPNKVVSETETDQYISSIDKNNSSSDATHTGTIETTGGINVIELKRQYLNLLYNIWETFALEFSSCFLHIYGAM